MAQLTPAHLTRLARLKSRDHVRIIESGAPGIHGDTLAKLSDVFGVSMNWLYRGDGKAPTRADVLVAVARSQRAYEQKESA